MIVGASLGRTGTYSLKLALERLGFAPCLHMSDLAADPALAGMWLEELSCARPDWQRLLEGYRAVVDWPGCNYVASLLEHFPDAKVIYCERPFEDWFASLQQTIFPALKWLKNLPPEGRSPFVALADNEVLDKTFSRRLDFEHVETVYRAHRQAAFFGVPTEQRLIFDIAEGWSPLCDFLSCPVPSDPFPISNRSSDFINVLRRRRGS